MGGNNAVPVSFLPLPNQITTKLMAETAIIYYWQAAAPSAGPRASTWGSRGRNPGVGGTVLCAQGSREESASRLAWVAGQLSSVAVGLRYPSTP